MNDAIHQHVSRIASSVVATRRDLHKHAETDALNEYMMAEAVRVVKAAGDMWGCTHTTALMGRCGNALSDKALVDRAVAVAKSIPAFTNIRGIEDFGAGEDFSHMMDRVQKNGGQATFIQTGTNRTAGHHNDCFDFDDADLVPAVEMLVRLVRDYLGEKHV